MKLALPLPSILLLLVSVQAALLVPYAILVPGERTNLLTPTLVLLPALLLLPRFFRTEPLRRWLPWLVLGVGLVAVSWTSPDPLPALFRSYAFYVPTAAGILCGSQLFRSEAELGPFFLVQTLCFALLAGACLLFGTPPYFFDFHQHALTGMLVLLSAGPVHLMLTRPGLPRWGAALLLALGYLVCFLAESRFLVLLPLVLVPLLLLRGRLRLGLAVPALLGAALLAGLFFLLFPQKALRYTNYESTFYRLEGIPASLELIRMKPWTGIGIRTPRAELLTAYEPSLGMVDKEGFLEVVKRNVTSDNQYLSLPVGVGLPLAVLYFFLAGRLLLRFFTGRGRFSLESAVGKALAFPLLATLIHMFLYDGLFYPQICWFFHLMLGAAGSAARATEAKPGSER